MLLLLGGQNKLHESEPFLKPKTASKLLLLGILGSLILNGHGRSTLRRMKLEKAAVEKTYKHFRRDKLSIISI